FEPLDADGVPPAPDDEEHRLSDLLVHALHDRERCLALVEPLDHRRAEPHELPAEAIGPRLRARLDEVERFEALQQAIRRRPRLVEQLRQPARRRLPLFGKLLEQMDGFRERANGVLTNLRLPCPESLRLQWTPPFRILDTMSA